MDSVFRAGTLVRSCSLPNMVQGIVIGQGSQYTELVAVRVQDEDGYPCILYFFPEELELVGDEK